MRYAQPGSLTRRPDDLTQASPTSSTMPSETGDWSPISGAGSYEPAHVVAVEPSRVMIDQRPPNFTGNPPYSSRPYSSRYIAVQSVGM